MNQDQASFDLLAFGRAMQTGDLGYQLARYAADADVRITTDAARCTPRIVSGGGAISAWLHECAAADPTPTVSHLVDGGDRVSFTQQWHNSDGTAALALSTAELQDGLISTQHTILIERPLPETSETDSWAHRRAGLTSPAHAARSGLAGGSRRGQGRLLIGDPLEGDGGDLRPA